MTTDPEAADLEPLFEKLARSSRRRSHALNARKFHRRQLERQHDAGHGVLRWLPLTFVPGPVLLFTSYFIEITPISWKGIIFTTPIVIVFFTWIAIVMPEREWMKSSRRRMGAGSTFAFKINSSDTQQRGPLRFRRILRETWR